MTWVNAVIGDLVEPRVDQGGPTSAEFTYVDISSIDNATKRVTDPKQLPREKAPSRARQRLEARDVVVSMTRPNLNAVALLPSELDGAIGSTGFDVLRAKPGVEPAWLYYAVQTSDFIHAMSGVVQGALYPAVRPRDIRGFPLIVPPLEEQRRIVAEIEERLSRLEAGVAALKRVRANLQRYRAAVLSAAVTGTLTSSTPEQWETAAIEELARDIRYGTSAKTSADIENGIPVLRMGNIEQGRLVFESLKYLSSGHPEFPVLLLNPGDLLFNRTNSPELVGKSAIYHGVPEECSFASYLIRVRFGPRAMPEFVNAYINSSLGRAWVKNVVSQQVGQANVNGSKLKALKIPLPSIEEQLQIVAEVDRRLSVVEELDTQVSANLARAEWLRQSCLSKAFQG